MHNYAWFVSIMHFVAQLCIIMYFWANEGLHHALLSKCWLKVCSGHFWPLWMNKATNKRHGIVESTGGIFFSDALRRILFLLCNSMIGTRWEKWIWQLAQCVDDRIGESADAWHVCWQAAIMFIRSAIGEEVKGHADHSPDDAPNDASRNDVFTMSHMEWFDGIICLNSSWWGTWST